MAAPSLDGRYELEREAGAGAMGTVYRAVDKKTGERVAVKILREGGGSERTGRFAREVRLLRGLSHPGIVRYLDEGSTRWGEPYLVMEWLEGQSLASYLDRESPALADAVVLVAALADALGAAQAAGIVHRDLKPSNLILSGRGPTGIKLVDFGIARAPSHEELTDAGAIIGTPGYMSPEQARGAADVDGRSDLFSLGCVLYRAITGRAPFTGDDVLAVLVKLVLEDPVPVRDLRPDAPPRLVALVDALLAKSPADRPATARVVRDELLAIAGELPAGVSRPPPPPSRRSAVLTTGELRICAVVLALPAHGAIGGETTVAEADADAIRTAVGRFGATLEVLRNGAYVVAVTGKGPATDRAARAIRCALLLRRMLPGAALAVGTGRAVVTDASPLGEVIDRAVRLLARARSGAIVVDDVAKGLLDARFTIEERDGLNVLVAESRGEPIRKLLGKPIACVGRERELAALQALYDECTNESVARAALVIGDAGIGKSRLCHEFLRRLEGSAQPPIVLLGRGDPLSAGSPFSLVAPALRRMAGIQDDEPLETRRSKLNGLADPVEPPRRAHVIEFLGELTGIPAVDESVAMRTARSDPALMADLMRGAWESWLEAVCRAHPVLLVVEDLHWGDLPSTKLMRGALQSLSDKPLMVLALARPAVDDLLAAASIVRGAAVRIRLPPLAKDACERLVQEALGADIAEETVDRLIAYADGNAFHLEELVRAFAAGLPTTPQTVVAMLQARLDDLDPEARRAIRAASVFGAVFWRGGLGALLGDGGAAGVDARVDEALHQLERHELVTKRTTSRFAGEAEYAFRHALVTEAAYAMLTEGDRALGHRLAAKWLEARFEIDAKLIAEHYERSDEPGSAASWNARAAEVALEAGDFEMAVARAESALAVVRDEAARGLLRRIQAEAHHWRADYVRAKQAATESVGLLPTGSAAWLQATTLVVRSEMAQATAHHTRRMAETLVDLPLERILPAAASYAAAVATCIGALQHRLDGSTDVATWTNVVAGLSRRLDDLALLIGDEDPMALAWIASARSWRAFEDGELGLCHSYDQMSLRAFQRAGDVRNACTSRAHVGYDELMLGRYVDAERSLRQAIAEAEPMGLGFVLGQAKHNLGIALMHLGRIDEAHAMELEALATLEKGGAKLLAGWTRAYLGRIDLAKGRHDDAWRNASAAIQQSEISSPGAVIALAVATEIRLSEGRTEEALALTRRFEALLANLGAMPEGEAYVHLVRAQALERAGLFEEARRSIMAASDRLLERAACIRDAVSRGSFLDAVPEHARLLALARAWRDR